MAMEILRWDNRTPFGVPVEPLVYMIIAISSAVGSLVPIKNGVIKN